MSRNKLSARASSDFEIIWSRYSGIIDDRIEEPSKVKALVRAVHKFAFVTTILSKTEVRRPEHQRLFLYAQLAEDVQGFLARLRSSTGILSIRERQRVLRLLVKEVLVSLEAIHIKHSIPVPPTAFRERRRDGAPLQVIFCVRGAKTRRRKEPESSKPK